MPKTTQNILLEDLYRTKTSSAISSSGDITFTVTTPPQNKKGYIILEPDNDSKREKMFYNDVVGNTIHVKGINRINPTDHIIGVNVQINDTSLIFNHLFEQDATTFYCEKTGNLSLNVWGGPVLRGIETINIIDTPITIINNVTNYIYYKSETNQILSSTSESSITTDKGIVVAEVIAASGIITSVKYRNHKFSVGNFISSIEETSVSGRTHTYTVTFTDGTTFEYDVLDGKSAYEVAVDEGFVGTEEQWLISIRGEKGVIWRGAFNIATAYIPYDLVSYQGTTYINIVASTGVLPTNILNFEIFASRGSDGDVSPTDLSNAIDGVTAAFQDADLLKADKCNIVTISSNYTFNGTEVYGTGFSTNTTSGNITYTLDLSLFETFDGLYEFIFCKSTADSNKVIIDVGSGKTIDNSQTYELSNHWETVTIKIASSTFAKVVATSNKATVVSVGNFQKSIVAGEDITENRLVRLGKSSNGDSSNPNTILQNTEGGTSNLRYFSYTNSGYEVGQGVLSGQTGFLKEISVWMLRSGSAVDLPFNMEIFSDATFTTLIGTSTNSYNQNLLGVTSQKVTFSFLGLPVPSGQMFYFKLNKLTTTAGNPNWVDIMHSGSSLYPNGIGYTLTNTGVVTTYAGNDIRFESITETSEDPERVYLSNSNIEGKADFIGNALSTVTKGNALSVRYRGIIGGFSGLTPGIDYFVNGTAGQVSSTPGTNRNRVGVAISATEIFMYDSNLEKLAGTFFASRNRNAASGTVTYSHNLKKIPKKIRILAVGTSNAFITSDGYYTELSGNNCVYLGSSGFLNSTSRAVSLNDGVTNGNWGIVQNVTATSFDIAWTLVGTPTSQTSDLLFVYE